VDADSTRGGALVEMDGYGLGDLLLQVAEILALRGDAAYAGGSSHQATSQPDCASGWT
jgi:hypothetical protein